MSVEWEVETTGLVIGSGAGLVEHAVNKLKTPTVAATATPVITRFLIILGLIVMFLTNSIMHSKYLNLLFFTLLITDRKN